jgi:ABC-3C biological conflict system middle component
MENLASSRLFNGPVETGLRSLMLLAESYPKPLDVQRLVILDYLLVHSGDIDGGPPSIHPPSPLRAGEVSIRRGLLESGLHLFATKGLIRQVIDATGMSYVADDLAITFLDALTSDQCKNLRFRAQWATELAGDLTDQEAMRLLEKTIGRWKSEFVLEGETEA